MEPQLRVAGGGDAVQLGSGQAAEAAVVLAQLRADNSQVSYLQPALDWLDGWLAELKGAPEPDWMAHGIPAKDKGKDQVNSGPAMQAGSPTAPGVKPPPHR